MGLGSESGPSTSKQESTSYTPSQKQWLDQMLSIYGPQVGQGQAGFPGQRVAPLTPLQEQIIGQGGDYLNAFAPWQDTPLYGQTQTALSGLLQGTTGAQPYTPESTAAYYKGTIEAPSRWMYEQKTAPAISEMWAGPGYWSSGRAKAQQEGRQDFEQWLGTERSKLYWDVEQQNRAIEEAKAQRALQATGPAMQATQLPTQENLARFAGLEAAYGLAQIPQQQRQAAINAAIQKFQEGQRLTDPEILTVMMGLLGMQYQSSSGTATGPGFWYSALSGVPSAMAGAMVPRRSTSNVTYTQG